MEEYRPVSNRTRLLFALVGLLTCLVGALCAELALSKMKASALLRRCNIASLLYITSPRTSLHSLEDTAPPPDEEEVQRRLELARAQTGEVQISLAWNNNNDLDLSCIDPFGESVDGYNQSSPSGGMLDVDMNSTPPDDMSPEAKRQDQMRRRRRSVSRSAFSDRPVENLIWQRNAPVGHYKVFVHQYCNKELVERTPYWLVIRIRGKVKMMAGAVGREDFADQLVDPQLVYEFDLGPAGNDAAVTKPDAHASVSAPPPRMVTRHAYTLSHLEFALITAGLWGALVGLLPMTLLIAQRLYLRQPALHGAEDLVILLGGLASGFCAALLGQLTLALLASAVSPGAFPVLFVLGWTLLGGFFGCVLSLYTPNVPRIGGLIAGALSAFAGSIFFLLLAAANQDMAGRLLCATLMGAAIGALIALPEFEREPEPEPLPEIPRASYEIQPPFVVRGTRTRKVGGLRQTGPPKN